MGDRSNVVILQRPHDPPVVLYSHWGGYEFQKEAERAIQAAGDMGVRIGDASYFTRKLVKEVLDHISGIGTTLDDNEYPVLVIDSLDGALWTVTEREASLLVGVSSDRWRRARPEV